MTFLRRLFLDALLPALLLLGIFYNSLMAINGPEGTIVLKRLEQEKQETIQLLVAKRAERAMLAKRADMLSLRSMDSDLLDETMRKVLGLTAPDELVIPATELEKYLEMVGS